jgi:hypothetical protein
MLAMFSSARQPLAEETSCDSDNVNLDTMPSSLRHPILTHFPQSQALLEGSSVHHALGVNSFHLMKFGPCQVAQDCEHNLYANAVAPRHRQQLQQR